MKNLPPKSASRERLLSLLSLSKNINNNDQLNFPLNNNQITDSAIHDQYLRYQSIAAKNKLPPNPLNPFSNHIYFQGHPFSEIKECYEQYFQKRQEPLRSKVFLRDLIKSEFSEKGFQVIQEKNAVSEVYLQIESKI